MRGHGKSCQEDSECRTYNPHLRCYTKPGLDSSLTSRRCQCRARWKNTGRGCSPPPGWKAPLEPTPASPKVDYVAVLMPTVLLSLATLVISICACYYIHTGNRELHRELKREHHRSNLKYQIDTREEDSNHKEVEQPPEARYIERVLVSDSDSDDGDQHLVPVDVEVPGVPSPSANVIEKVKENHQNMQTSALPPARIGSGSVTGSVTGSVSGSASGSVSGSVSGSRLSVRSLEGKRSGLHPLNGLVQPTGLVPGYQANMRLLFRQRPASAVSLAAGLTSQHFVLKSRPASAISRISTTARLSPGNSSDISEEETELSKSQNHISDLRVQEEKEEKVELEEKEEMVGKKEEKVRETDPPGLYSQHSKSLTANGHTRHTTNGPVKNGIRKNVEPTDSDSNCPKSSVRFSSEIVSRKKQPKNQTSSTLTNSGKPKVFHKIHYFRPSVQYF